MTTAHHPDPHRKENPVPIAPVWRVQCSGPCRRWLCLPDGYGPGEDVPLAALVPQPTAERAGLWPTETAARRARVAAGWSGGYCPDCAAARDGDHSIYCPDCTARRTP